MSRVTNIHGLPQSIVAAVLNDPYTGGGDISATKLIDAPRVQLLTKLHREKLSVDVSERVWSLLGQAVHTILERAGLREQGMVVEQRLFAEVNGWQVSGQFDVMHLEERTISDYKVTTTYKQHGSDSWTRQMNVLRWLAHKNGSAIDRLQIVAIFRDWRKTESERNPEYPKAAIQVIPVPVWPLDETEEYIRERVALHQEAAEGVEIDCTDEERWYSGTSYALIKPGNKRATKVSATPFPEAEIPEGMHVLERPGEYKRCLHYCDVSAFCSQWHETQQTLGLVAGDG